MDNQNQQEVEKLLNKWKVELPAQRAKLEAQYTRLLSQMGEDPTDDQRTELEELENALSGIQNEMNAIQIKLFRN